VPLRIERDQRARLSDVADELPGVCLAHVELDAVQREFVRRTPVEIPAPIVILEERGIPRTRLNVPGLWVASSPRRQIGLRFTGNGARQMRQAACQEIPLPARRIARHEDRVLARGRRHQDEPTAIRYRRGRDDARERPAARGDEAPVEQIGGAPVAVGQRHEQVVRLFVPHDDGIGARAVGDPLVDLLEVVSIVDVDRIRVGAPGVLRGDRAAREPERRRDDRRQVCRHLLSVLLTANTRCRS
jgi:hypothetical protein